MYWYILRSVCVQYMVGYVEVQYRVGYVEVAHIWGDRSKLEKFSSRVDRTNPRTPQAASTVPIEDKPETLRVRCLKHNLNASRPSGHPTPGGKYQNA